MTHSFSPPPAEEEQDTHTTHAIPKHTQSHTHLKQPSKTAISIAPITSDGSPPSIPVLSHNHQQQLHPSICDHVRSGDRLVGTCAGLTTFPLEPTSPGPVSVNAKPPKPPSYATTTNAVISSKYTLLTFLPINLFEQFQNVANIYFLLVGILQIIGPISTTNGIPTMYEPLAFIIFISAVRAAKEDYDKHMADSKRNGYQFDVFRPETGFIATTSGQLRVGDIVRIQENDMIPADCLFLASSHNKGHCFVDKANLNGETRLEVMNSMIQTRTLCNDHTLLPHVSLQISYEPPNKHFDTFRGYLVAMDTHTQQIHEGTVDGKTLLMRETVLRNTEYIFALVVYTGDDTKIQRSNLEGEKPRNKQSAIMRKVDQLLKLMLLIQMSLCALGAILAGCYNAMLDDHWYLELSTDYTSTVIGILAFFTWFILLSSMVPISLIVSGELVKFTQSVFIQWDIRLYSQTINKPAKCNSSSIHEDLGLVDFIFTDKTGTLTQNKMEFRYALLDDGSGSIAGAAVTSNEGASTAASQLDVHEGRVRDHSHSEYLEFGSKETDIAKSVKIRQAELAEKQQHSARVDAGRQQPDSSRGVKPKAGDRSWTELEACFYPQKNDKDREKSCFDRYFPAFVRKCWNTAEDTEEIEQQKVSEQLMQHKEHALRQHRSTARVGVDVEMATPRIQTAPTITIMQPDAEGLGAATTPSSQANHDRTRSIHNIPASQHTQSALPSPFPLTTAHPPSASLSIVNSMSSSQASASSRSSSNPNSSSSSSGNTFTDAEKEHLLQALWGPPSAAESVHACKQRKQRLYRYLQHLALSNTVKPYEEDGELRYQAESAEELAMVSFARKMGFTKKSVNPTVLEVACYEESDINRERKLMRMEMFNHVATFGFTSRRARVTVIYQRISASERERMEKEKMKKEGSSEWNKREEHKRMPSSTKTSIITKLPALQPSPRSMNNNQTRHHTTNSFLSSSFPYWLQEIQEPQNNILIMTKGQDTVILPFLSLQGINESALLLSLKDMSTNGLRTLVCGYADQSVSWWKDREPIYLAIVARDQSVNSEGHPERCKHEEGNCEKCVQHRVFEEMEQEAQMQYLGVLGLEDQLQPLVPECIADCLKAGIKVWMITGDKLETAKNIGLACNLIDADMMPTISSDTDLTKLVQDLHCSRLLEITGQWANLAEDEDEMSRLFDSLDTDGNGIIDYQEMLMVLKTLRCSIPEERLKVLVNMNTESLATTTAPGIGSAVPIRGIGRAAFLELMQSTSLTHFEAVKYDIESGIKVYNNIKDHSLYPVSILVDRTAFQVMFPSPTKSKKKQTQTQQAGLETQKSQGDHTARSVRQDPPVLSPSGTLTQLGNTTSPPLSPRSAAVAAAPVGPSAAELELLRAKFFELARHSKSVVFARAEPAMKKRMVTEIQARVKDVITLAIGDGANDTDMIQAAHIGVGISGVEGTAATNSADYAIGTFRMLHTLLFVHGCWSYSRQAKLVNFIFYKASLVAVCMYLFGFFSAFSGQQFFDDPIYEIYNVIYLRYRICTHR